MPTFPPQRVSDSDAADIYLWLRQQKKIHMQEQFEHPSRF